MNLKYNTRFICNLILKFVYYEYLIFYPKLFIKKIKILKNIYIVYKLLSTVCKLSYHVKLSHIFKYMQ